MSVQTAREQLWNDPDPVTSAGRDLWTRFTNEGYPGAALLSSEVRDIGQRIRQVEQEAAALALGRVEAAVRAAERLLDVWPMRRAREQARLDLAAAVAAARGKP